MTRHPFLHLDVFTSRPLTGNQLAVFPDATGLDRRTMQAVAAEMAFPETTFVLPPEAPGTEHRVRIFTPRTELPIAGHPTIGTAFALAHAGRLTPGRDVVVLGLGAGPTPVELEWQAGRLAFAWMTQPLPRFGPVVSDTGGLAAALGVRAADVAGAAEVGSIGLAFCLVPLASRAAVDAARLDAARFAALLGAAGHPSAPAFVFSTEAGPDGATAYCRMFAPDLGVAEDPATGAAHGPLGAWLVRRGVAPREMVNVQGVAMRRPSRVHVRVDVADGAVTRVRVGGEAVVVAESALRVA